MTCTSEQSPYFTKDPDAELDYGIDWTAWLVEDDTIATSDWIVPDDLEKSNPSITDGKTTVWLAGGTVGQTYAVVNRITTAQGRTDDRTLFLVIQEK